MTDKKSPASSLPPVLRAAIEKFDQWTQQHMESEDKKTRFDEAVAIFFEAINANADVVKDETIRDDFIQQLCRDIISAPLIWNCLTSKHPAYKREKEVRLLMLNQRNNLMPYIKTRLRGSEIVPYIPHPQPIREPDIIAEIVVGPAAGPDAGAYGSHDARYV